MLYIAEEGYGCYYAGAAATGGQQLCKQKDMNYEYKKKPKM